MLPHQKNPQKEEEPFTTMDREMAKVYKETHPHYDEEDYYGTKAALEPDTEDDDDKETA
jgi:hypothetical protein